MLVGVGESVAEFQHSAHSILVVVVKLDGVGFGLLAIVSRMKWKQDTDIANLKRAVAGFHKPFGLAGEDVLVAEPFLSVALDA